jgi:hypothetical protein
VNTSRAQNIVLIEVAGIGAITILASVARGDGFPPPVVYPAIGALAGGMMILAMADGETAVALGGLALVATALSEAGGQSLAQSAFRQLPRLGRGLRDALSRGESAQDQWRAAFSEVAAAVPSPSNPGPSPVPASTEGGARGIVERAAAVGIARGGSGVVVVSALRPGDRTSSGALSDHSANDASRAARDIAVQGVNALTGPPSPKLDAAVVAIGQMFGRDYGDGKRTIIDTFHWRGYRVQILWRTPLYGGHMGHIHIGVRKD